MDHLIDRSFFIIEEVDAADMENRAERFILEMKCGIPSSGRSPSVSCFIYILSFPAGIQKR